MAGFWMKTEEGSTIHVNGDPNMPKETRQALGRLMDAATKEIEISGFTVGQIARALLAASRDESANEKTHEATSSALQNLCHECKDKGVDLKSLMFRE